MKIFHGCATALFLCLAVSAQAEAPATPAAREAQVQAIVKSEHPQRGIIHLPDQKVSLNLGSGYYFLDAADARRVIVEGWGNPPDSAEGVLGLVLPEGKNYATSAWGAVLTYDKTGFVKDDDAKTTDYNKLLDQLREGEAENNKERKDAGYDPIHLVGWAEAPNYDATTHSVVWARELQFGSEPLHGLNYDLRLLGREGVISVNMVAGMSDLPSVRSAASNLGKTVTFDNGARYADFNASTDKIADYGVGGLVAAGLGVVAAKKLGLLAIVLGLGKKLIVVFVAMFAALRNKIAGLFGRKRDTLEG